MIYLTILLCALFNPLPANNCEPYGILYAPGRSALYAPATPQPDGAVQPSCKLCKAAQENANNEFPLLHTKYFTVTLNLFPYAKGHMLIIPKSHTKTIYDLTKHERAELIELIADTTQILEHTFQAAGINFGYNQGRAAGASIPDHMHIHVLPRFTSENAFIQTIGNTRVIQWEFKDLQSQLLPHFALLKEKYEIK